MGREYFSFPDLKLTIAICRPKPISYCYENNFRPQDRVLVSILSLLGSDSPKSNPVSLSECFPITHRLISRNADLFFSRYAAETVTRCFAPGLLKWSILTAIERTMLFTINCNHSQNPHFSKKKIFFFFFFFFFK